MFLFRKLLAAAAIMVCCAIATSAQVDQLTGYWTGTVARAGKFWRVAMTVGPVGSGKKALVDFPDADGYKREFSISTSPDGRILLTRPQPTGIPIVFEGSIINGKFRGDWSGFGQRAAFTLWRAKPEPVSHRELGVTYQNGPVTLAGTLLVPEGNGPFPAVVVTHGGDQNVRATNIGWAMKFMKAGFAALIYDKRGSGLSTGETRSASMEDLASDAVAGVHVLKTRPEIDGRRIGVIGHSQGGWIAPLAATMSSDVAFVIASAASGVSPDKQSIYHRANMIRAAGFSEQTVELASELRRKLYVTGRMILEGDPRTDEERAKLSAELQKYARETWLDEVALPADLSNDKPTIGGLKLLFFEPEPMWEKVNVPVLLMWGDKDKVVPIAEGRTRIEAALKRAGNEKVTARIFPNVDHTVAHVTPKNEWDFPRIDLNYYKFMVQWAKQIAMQLTHKI